MVGSPRILEMRNANSSQITTYGDAPITSRGDYAELKRLIKEKGLLNRQPLYYTSQILLILCLLGASITVLALIDNLWLQLLNAGFLAFVFQQIVFIGHDSAHREIFGSAKNNNVIALISWNLLLGVSNGWWMGRHNSHHAHTNELDVDPDTELGFLCFSEAGAVRRTGFQRLLLQYQAYLMPVLSLYPIMLRYYTFKFLLQSKGSYVGKVPIQRQRRPVEIVLVIVHYVWFLGLPIYFLGIWQALLFILIQQALFGIYYASVTASNHKGMPTLIDGNLGFLRQQVLTSRNVRSHPLIDFWYGGLNFQIEHHLFPSLPRNKLRETQRVVRRFCEEWEIGYHQTGLVQSYREILASVHSASWAARER